MSNIRHNINKIIMAILIILILLGLADIKISNDISQDIGSQTLKFFKEPNFNNKIKIMNNINNKNDILLYITFTKNQQENSIATMQNSFKQFYIDTIDLNTVKVDSTDLSKTKKLESKQSAVDNINKVIKIIKQNPNSLNNKDRKQVLNKAQKSINSYNLKE